MSQAYLFSMEMIYSPAKKIALVALIALTVTFVWISSCSISVIPQTLTRIEYSTLDQEFQYVVIPKMGRDLEMMEESFEEFKSKLLSNHNIILYRTTKKHWCNIWNWHKYAFRPEWKYPYKDIIIL